uniref:Tyrosine-protein kinase n=1 Tax=Steinernema glaseri TaxID=37863 RepID=A0A1I8ABK4_9BILA
MIRGLKTLFKSKKLEDQPWYHGLRSRDDIAALLKDVGDWLVRATQSHNKTEIVLNVCTASGINNLTLKMCGDNKKKYALKVLVSQNTPYPAFDSVYELCKFYRKHRLPGNVRLRKAIHRPTWLIKHEAIHFNVEKDKLGSGNFCDVFKGKFKRQKVGERAMNADVAIKVCHPVPDKDKKEAQEARLGMLREAKLMSHYRHDHVIEFYGVACDHPPVMIVMEFCPGGSLENHLRNQETSIENGERVLYCFEAARGMRYLHAQQCIHRDLASRNCLISAIGSIKIADFGLSKIVNDMQGEVAIKNIPLRWMAPETLSKQPEYSEKSDVWSFGVLMYEIFNLGEKPWADEDDFKVIAKNIKKNRMVEPPAITPEAVKVLMKKTWSHEAKQRPPFKEIVSFLLDYQMLSKLPAPSELRVNRIPGVKRERGYPENVEEIKEGRSIRALKTMTNYEDDMTKETVSVSGSQTLLNEVSLSFQCHSRMIFRSAYEVWKAEQHGRLSKSICNNNCPTAPHRPILKKLVGKRYFGKASSRSNPNTQFIPYKCPNSGIDPYSSQAAGLSGQGAILMRTSLEEVISRIGNIAFDVP